jgi:tryptophanyl-tRNA synthetase
VEISREIVRRFNYHFGIFIDSEALSRPENAAAVFPLDRMFAGKPNVTGPAARSYDRERVLALEQKMRTCIREIGYENFVAEFSKSVETHKAVSQFVQFRSVLTEPEHQLTKTPRIPGLDGRKMSKSYGNAIMLSESDADIRAKTKVMVTDPARKRRTDPGNPDVCPVYDWHKLFSTPETLKWSAEGCRTAGIGCIECKAKMADHLIEWITPIREKRVKYEQRPAQVLEVIDSGSAKAREVAKGTMERVREAVFGWQKKRAENKKTSFEVHDTHA